MNIRIREEQPGDREEVYLINAAAFGRKEEADLVDALRISCDGLLSLVAIVDSLPVGHVLFSPVTIDGPGARPEGMGLAPMAVLPEYQRRGVGSNLVGEGLRRLREASLPFVVVLGHPGYYPRFGFRPASAYGLRCQWEGVPDDAFMILVFDESALLDVSGVIRYRDEFDEAS